LTREREPAKWLAMAIATKARLTRIFSARILAFSAVSASILPTFLLFLCEVHAASAGCDAGPQERATIVSVDDRLDFTLADARQVRLAGLDPADPDHGDPATAGAARAFAIAWLSGREVGLRLLSAKPDRWGRTLVDLFSPPPTAGAGTGPVSVALFLLGVGHARVWPEPEARECLAKRLRAEGDARDKRLGLWRDPYYGVVEAADLDNLRDRDGQFTIVEGTPRRVGEGRSRYYVDFGPRRGFTIVIPKKRAKVFERAGVTIQALAGAKIRARGALDNRFGLRMEISEPEDIEAVDKGDSAKGDAQQP
jgi:micrococcal nuclease